jgi:hypothetical protein
MQRRGSYFYVIDAFIASIIIIGAFIVLISHFISQQPPTTAFYTAEDFLTTVESTKVLGYDNDMVRDWVSAGMVNDSTRTMLQQLAAFELDGNAGNATGNLSLILATRAPRNVNLEIRVNGNQRFIRQDIDPERASTLLSSKRIVLLQRNVSSIYSPAIVEVRTWQ